MSKSTYVDIFIDNVPRGTLVYPSATARKRGFGGYQINDEYLSAQDDVDLFPAIVIDPESCAIVTPTGFKLLAKHSLVSVMR